MSKRFAEFICLVIVAVLVMLSLAGCASPASPAPAATQATKASSAPAAQPAATFPKMDVRLGHVNNTEASWHKGNLKFAELVKERTGGAVNVQIFPNSQLGNEKDLIEQVKNGVIEMSMPSAGMLAVFDGWQPLGVFGMPYIFAGDTEEDQLPVFLGLARGPMLKEIAENAAKKSGMRSLDMGWWYGLRHLTTKSKQVTKVDDLKGMKIRTPDAPVQKLAMTALGAAVTPMAFAELYTALQLGVVDGQENPLNTSYVNKFYEVQKYLTLTGHMTQHQVLIVNDKWFQGLSPQLQDILIKSAVEAGDYQNDLQIKANKQNLEDLKAKGMIVNTVNKAEFAEKTKDAWKEFEAQFGKGLYEKVKEAQK